MARYAVGGWVHGFAGPSFPWGTLVVNVAGSLALGLAAGLLQSSTVTPELRAFLTVGLLGAFTTFSTFSYEAMTLVQDSEWTRAAGYVAGSVAFGLTAVFAGYWMAAALLHRGG